MYEGWGKYFAAAPTGTSVLASLLLTFDALGTDRAVWAIVAVVVLTLALTLVALWFARSRTIEAYREGAAASRSKEGGSTSSRAIASAADREFLTTQVVPAFLDGGLDRTRDFFTAFIARLDLSDEEREMEEAFLTATLEDETLSRRARIDRIVHHFAPEEQSGNSRATSR
jgi:hypothetical protein